MRVPLLPHRIRLGAAVVVAAAILVASVLPPPDGTPAQGPFGLVGLDAWLHAGAYGILALAVAYAGPARSRRELAAATGVAAGFGLFVEAVQFGLPYRSFAVADAATNAFGATVVATIWRALSVGQRLGPDESVDARASSE